MRNPLFRHRLLGRGSWGERIQRLALKGLGGGILYGMVIEPRWLETTVLHFPVEGLNEAFEGYRIVHLTDIHHNMVTRKRFLLRAIHRANALKPDLVVLTGDYITHSVDRMETAAQLLGHLQAPDGVFATLGNHDYRCPVKRTRKLFEKAGIRLLENEYAVIAPRSPDLEMNGRPPGDGNGSGGVKTNGNGKRHGNGRGNGNGKGNESGKGNENGNGGGRKPCPPGGLCVVGVGDLGEGHYHLHRALAGSPEGCFRLLLSHNPQAAHLATPEDRIGLILSGHTHGGQAWPFHRSLAYPAKARRYLRGLVESPSTHVYVSRGIGTSAFHFRWNCRPEITLVCLHRNP